MLMTLMMMTATLGAAIYSIVVFAIGKPVEGFTTTMLVITGSFFGVFAILAIIIKYLSVLVDLIFLRTKVFD
jgi:polyisoprenyl-phosphate glycosyltransferase